MHVQGMTGSDPPGGAIRGSRPEHGIARIIHGPMPLPTNGAGMTRRELYRLMNDPSGAISRVQREGAVRVDRLKDRGHRVVYLAAPERQGRAHPRVITMGRPPSLTIVRTVLTARP